MGTMVQLIAQTADMTSAELIIGNYRGTAIITHATHIVDSWIDDVFNTAAPYAGTNGRSVAVGLHIECTPPIDTIALLQLCVGGRCLVYQLRHRRSRSLPARLNDFLNDDRFCFVGVNVDLAVLQLRVQHGLRVRSAADIRDAASRRLQREDLRWAGIDQLAWEVIRMQIIRLDGMQRGALFQRVLPPEIIGHACLDAIFSHEIARVLSG